MGEVTGTIELWRWKFGAVGHGKERVECSAFISKKNREQLMTLWNRKYKLHLPNLFFYLIKPNDYGVDDRGTSGVLENETIGYSPIEDFAEVQY